MPTKPHIEKQEALAVEQAEEVVEKKKSKKHRSGISLEDLATFQDELITTVRDQAGKTQELNDTISKLSESMEGLSETIKNGFRIISMGAKLFRMVIWAFITVIAILGAVIVYITQVDIDPLHGKIGRRVEKTETVETTVVSPTPPTATPTPK